MDAPPSTGIGGKNSPWRIFRLTQATINADAANSRPKPVSRIACKDNQYGSEVATQTTDNETNQ